MRQINSSEMDIKGSKRRKRDLSSGSLTRSVAVSTSRYSSTETPHQQSQQPTSSNHSSHRPKSSGQYKSMEMDSDRDDTKGTMVNQVATSPDQFGQQNVSNPCPPQSLDALATTYPTGTSKIPALAASFDRRFPNSSRGVVLIICRDMAASSECRSYICRPRGRSNLLIFQ